MPISDRDQAILENLTHDRRTDHHHHGRLADGKRRVVLLGMAVAGMAALPVGIATNRLWIGLIGFLVAVPTSAQLLAKMSCPSRGWLRDQGLLPTITVVDRRGHDATMATRRTLMLPRRPIGLIVVSLVIAAVTIQPAERTSSAILSCPPVTRSCGARMVWGLFLAP
jgi:hypothetical protein